jgi:hypothetical protein
MSTETSESSVSIGQPTDGVVFPPILDELRDVAMRMHTREQAPREGRADAPAKPAEPYVPTHMDYLQFLVDSHAVYEVLERIVNDNEKLAMFRSTGIERTAELEKDIAWMCGKFDLERPGVGMAGMTYAEELKAMVESDDDIPEFMCHYYNYYFAHLAGGRMIGKQMSKLLLDGETLEFYKVSCHGSKTGRCNWEFPFVWFFCIHLLWRLYLIQWGEDVNDLKAKVKDKIEEIAKQWTREERDKCVNATAGAFKGGGAINGYLYGGSPH